MREAIVQFLCEFADNLKARFSCNVSGFPYGAMACCVSGDAGRDSANLATSYGKDCDCRRKVLLAVNGTLMRGLKLNCNMLAARATFVREAKTEPTYRLWTINDEHPAMLRVTDGTGAKIAVEVWSVPEAGLANILLSEPPGLCVGKVRLEDGSVVLGVLGEPALVEGCREITAFGGWRGYLAQCAK